MQGVDWTGFATAAYELGLFDDDFSELPKFSDHYLLSKVRAAAVYQRAAVGLRLDGNVTARGSLHHRQV